MSRMGGGGGGTEKRTIMTKCRKTVGASYIMVIVIIAVGVIIIQQGFIHVKAVCQKLNKYKTNILPNLGLYGFCNILES